MYGNNSLPDPPQLPVCEFSGTFILPKKPKPCASSCKITVTKSRWSRGVCASVPKYQLFTEQFMFTLISWRKAVPSFVSISSLSALPDMAVNCAIEYQVLSSMLPSLIIRVGPALPSVTPSSSCQTAWTRMGTSERKCKAHIPSAYSNASTALTGQF